MNKKQGILSWLNDLIKSGGKSDGKTSKYRYLVIVLCMGATFMIAGNILFKSSPSVTAASTTNSQPSNSNNLQAIGKNNTGTDYEQQYEDQLKKAIESMLGIKDLTVIVDLDSSEQQIYETNKSTQTQTTTETDNSGGHQQTENTTTNEQVVTTNNGNNQVPLLVETKKPAIRGVLVVAKGAQDINVKASIIEAVTKVLGVPSFMVAVEPQK